MSAPQQTKREVFDYVAAQVVEVARAFPMQARDVHHLRARVQCFDAALASGNPTAIADEMAAMLTALAEAAL